MHGVMLLTCMALLPQYLNMIPLSCLAAILFVTGVKLASPVMISKMWKEGRYQFIPFLTTVVAIVFTDLLTGILIGLAISVGFILNSNFRRPLKRYVEKHLGGDVLHIQLANQVGFLNRAGLVKSLEELPRGSHVLLDATDTDFIDPDVLGLIREFKERTAPLRGIEVSLLGFREKYHLNDEILYVDYSTRGLQQSITPDQVLQILIDGHKRFLRGDRLTRNFGRQISATADGQHPLAVVMSCIDSRSPAELIFDLGVGDIFSVRVAGNISSRKVLGSMEYGCAVAGAKLLLVMGHTRCGAITSALNFACSGESVFDATGCRNVEHLLNDIQGGFDDDTCQRARKATGEQKASLIDEIAKNNVLRTVDVIYEQSEILANMAREGRIAIVPAMYDVVTGSIEFLAHSMPAARAEEQFA
ncbi:MAG: carbonic anhydrase [Pirellulales bacterium]